MNLPLIIELTKANLKSRYRNTWAGLLWVVLNPIIIFTVQAIVFKNILKIDVKNYYLFLLSGLLPWIFLVQSIEMCTSIFVSNAAVLRSFKIDPLILIFSQLLDNFINFICVFFILFFVGTFSHKIETPESLFWIPVVFALMILAAAGLSLIFATLQVFFRDTRFIIQFVFQIMFFATPIFYPVDLIPEKYRFVTNFNVFHAIISVFRNTFINYRYDTFIKSLGVSILWIVGIWVIALYFWKSRRNEIILTL